MNIIPRLNFIKLQGIFNKSFICRTLEVKKFYNITHNRHENCYNRFVDYRFIKKLKQIIIEPLIEMF